MTAQPLRNDNVYPLRMEDAIGVGDVQPDSIQPASSTLAGALAINEEEAKPKKRRGRTPGSKNKTKKTKSAKAKLPPPPVDSVPETQAPVQSLRIAAGGDGVTRFFNIALHDRQLWVYVVGIVALVASLAFLTGALKP